MLNTNQIRQCFLDFFKSHNHTLINSSSLVPHNDPTLLFTNAGMVQFKDIFTGKQSSQYLRAATAQKCVRAGGKHNDLDNVGYTKRHHTFFEMLGNFSFGDYFKETAIELAWNLIKTEFKLPLDRLLVTVHASDEDAAKLWRKVAGLDDSRIIRINTNDNFWSMGDLGPCGPCSEIFFDHGPQIPGGPPGSAEADGDRFVEIWNLVFMQYEQLADGSRISLPQPSIDTGMGLERIAAVMQGVSDNFDTDIFKSLINATIEITGLPPHDRAQVVAYRIIADHLRAASFMIADGILPSNEGRGYVLRRIMRRAMRYVHVLGVKDLLLHQLVAPLVNIMGQQYSELSRAQPLISASLYQEEAKFRETLDRGLRLLDEDLAKLQGNKVLPGAAAFKLYDTYGFPVDLTENILRERGYGIDMNGFNQEMQRQRQLARKNWEESAGERGSSDLWFKILEQAGPTEFLGYTLTRASGRIEAVIEENAIITNQTPFYGEGGGQIGDSGVITSESGARFQVNETKKPLPNLYVHYGKLEQGTFKTGENVTLVVDEQKRNSIKRNHSATHLLHAALRAVLGGHVTQKGSLVNADKLRFDFSHFQKPTLEQLRQIEALVNQKILENSPVSYKVMAYDQAVKHGAMALFGEKYGAEVRVVTMGSEERGSEERGSEEGGSEDGDAFSVELCGGTHVNRTGDIGLFVIDSESSVAAGVRRIEAITGLNAMQYGQQNRALVQQIAEELKCSSPQILERIAILKTSTKSGSKTTGANHTPSKANVTQGKAGEINIILQEFHNSSDVIVRESLDQFKLSSEPTVAITTNVVGEKIMIAVRVSNNLCAQIDAAVLLREAVKHLGGVGGGGRRDFAQGGGSNITNIKSLVDAITRCVDN